MNILFCPHCEGAVEIEQINCGIFRHGAYKTTGQQIPPHLNREGCEAIRDQIYGCGGPFRYADGKLEICSYEN